MAHRYWRIDSFVCDVTDYVSFAEFYLRATVGGSNMVPTAYSQSGSWSSPTNDGNKVYDGNASTFWISQTTGGVAASWLAFDYGSAVNVAECSLLSPPSGDSRRAPNIMLVSYSDTGLSGPWTGYGYFNFTHPWSLAQTQVVDFPPPSTNVNEQVAYLALLNSFVDVNEQAAYLALLPNAVSVSEQTAYIALLGATVSVNEQTAYLPLLPQIISVNEQTAYLAIMQSSPPPSGTRRQFYLQ